MAAVLCACNVDAQEKACSQGVGAVVLHLPPIVPAKPIEGDLDVDGTIDRPAGIAIYSVLVGGVAATGGGLDFDAFTAHLPYARLVSLTVTPPDTGVPEAKIDVTARTNCGSDSAPLGSMSVPINLQPGVKLNRLAFDPPLIPNGADYLPADKTASAILRLRANPEAAGATIILSSSSGTFDGVSAANAVVLNGDGKADAVAAVGFESDRTAQISASGAGASASTSITVSGPPTLVPSDATLGPGQSVRVTIFTDGALRSCQATPASGITVTSGDLNLMATPGGKDLNGDGRVDIDVLVANPLPADAATTVSCSDVFGQSAIATYRAQR